MMPVADTEGSNKSWSEATPSGELWLAITNRAAFEQFTPGAEYLVSFDQVPK